ncbi:hypothetical protein CCAX7_64980 [Capsulimonas corticalis]|uniref:Uncharacterized protein n=2 Tax=Capsulimonas corticalis TaxID=2219043 RepID=A0A9N7LAL2_9BACT|nr:hypothetical protein CCAX7_64980 [Capsulimonas corticalis]
MAADWNLAAVYSSSSQGRYFQWDDAEHCDAGGLARLFIARFSEICEAGYGADWLYAGWYLEMLHRTYPDSLPIAYRDDEVMDGSLRATGGDIVIPPPPPGMRSGGSS